MPSPVVFAVILLAISIILGVLAVYKVFRIINTIITALLLLVALSSFYFAYDVQQLQKQVASQGQVFLLEENGELITAFTSVNSSAPETPSNMAELRASYSAGDLDQVKGDFAYIFITTPQTYENIESVTLGTYTFDKDFILQRIREQDPRAAYVAEIKKLDPELTDVPVALPDIEPEEFRSLLFAALATEYLKDTNIAGAVAKEDIQPYPNTATFWALRNIPTRFLKFAISIGE